MAIFAPAESLPSPATLSGGEDKDEEEMVNQAIALSMEATSEDCKEAGNDEVGREGECEENDEQLLSDAITLSLKEVEEDGDNNCKEGRNGSDDDEVLNQAIALSLVEIAEDDDDLLKQAIALSLTDWK